MSILVLSSAAQMNLWFGESISPHLIQTVFGQLVFYNIFLVAIGNLQRKAFSIYVRRPAVTTLVAPVFMCESGCHTITVGQKIIRLFQTPIKHNMLRRKQVERFPEMFVPLHKG
ncbi:hypothetical protein G9A89_007162 [Geosiphon pyriformis]|nr:hypothetical protein G9A89_007162 [Geosiphon pyriformis]